MRSILSTIVAFTAFHAAANEMPLASADDVVVSKAQITCHEDHFGVWKGKTGEEQQSISNGKISESTRTTWKVGNIEYRSSDFKSFSEDGTVNTEGTVLATVKITTNGNQRTEEAESVTYSRRLDGIVLKDGPVQVRKRTTRVVDLVEGGKSTTIEYLSDGKVENSRYVTTEFTTGQNQKAIKSVLVTPQVYVSEGAGVYVTEKSETICVYDTIE